MRVGFTPTPSRTTWLPGSARAAASGKAALERSPGTRHCTPSQPPLQSSLGSRKTIVPMTFSGTPSSSIIRSVWSRLRWGSFNAVGPAA